MKFKIDVDLTEEEIKYLQDFIGLENTTDTPQYFTYLALEKLVKAVNDSKPRPQMAYPSDQSQECKCGHAISYHSWGGSGLCSREGCGTCFKFELREIN